MKAAPILISLQSDSISEEDLHIGAAVINELKMQINLFKPKDLPPGIFNRALVLFRNGVRA